MNSPVSIVPPGSPPSVEKATPRSRDFGAYGSGVLSLAGLAALVVARPSLPPMLLIALIAVCVAMFVVSVRIVRSSSLARD